MGFSIEGFCPPNVTLNQVWLHHGFSACLLNTVISGVSLGFMLVFGSVQFWFYRKYATNVEFFALPYSQLFGLQMVLNSVMPLLAVIRLVLEAAVLKPGIIYGYMLLTLISGIVCWTMVASLILTERTRMLPSVARHGHGLILLIFWTWIFGSENLNFLNLRGTDWFFQLRTSTDIIYFALFVFEYAVTFGIFVLGLKAPGIPSFRNSESFTRLHPEGEEEGTTGESNQSTLSSWYGKMKTLAPFIWPSKSIKLQLYVISCFLMLILGRVTNVYVPLYSKKIVDSMTISVNSTASFEGHLYSLGMGAFHLVFRWDYILIYVSLRVVQGVGQGTSGLINIIRSLLWISVEQYTTREVQVHFFEHLLHLSLRFHLQRKTGEVLRSMDRGTESINNILNYLVFNIFPTVADIIIAIVYLTACFNGWFGLIVFTTMILYLAATFAITEWRTQFRRSMNQTDNEMKQQSIDSLLNFETVKYYTNEKYETSRYASAILRYQKQEWKVTASICVLNMVQMTLISVGLLAGSLLCVWMVVNNRDGMTVGDYILFTSYLLQLYGPLNFFGTYYRLLQRSFIDMENMLQLLKEEQEITDDPAAQKLNIRDGTIEFRNVSFSYVAGKDVLKNVSFTVPGGKSVALVGSSGGGKTSIIRLLFRFYDLMSGEILIDGQNIGKVTQMSLRQSIGVVPQDTVLFNDTIRQNILYGKIGSDDADLEEAAKAACIHDKVLTFPDGYETKVGERGLKLSGGEKQRVAIARTILKNPAVILLDEATSALDTHTERQIQASLQSLCENRTSIIVAHRLSTIVNVNQILVLKDGEIAESGTHNELMASQGVYADLWNEQLKSSNVEDLNENADEVGARGDETVERVNEPSSGIPRAPGHGGHGGHGHHRV